MKKVVLASLAAASLMSVLPGYAAPRVGMHQLQALQEIHDCWDSSESASGKTAKFTFYINAHKDVVSVELQESSGDSQFDAECAEALISHKPMTQLLPGYIAVGGCRPGEITFSSPAKYAGEDLKKYRHSHAISEDKVLVHVVPLSVQQLFPGLFKTEELLTESNIREIAANKCEIGVKETGFLKELVRMYAGLGKLYEKKYLTKFDVLKALEVPY